MTGRSSSAELLRTTLIEVVAAGAPGALGLIVDGTETTRFATGVATVSGETLAPASRFGVGSVTKTFVAALVLQLADEEAFGLDDGLDVALPGVVPGRPAPSVRSLLNHTSGLPDVFANPSFLSAWMADPALEWEPQELVRLALQQPAQPSGRFRYANVNYVLLALAVEATTGRALAVSLRERILAPLGLDDTELTSAGLGAAGGMVSTADDTARFLAALMREEIVTTASLQQMLSWVPTEWAESEGYGLGIERLDSMAGLIQSPCGAAWGHIGILAQCTTVALTTRDGKRQIVLMIASGELTDDVWRAIGSLTWCALCP